MKHLLRHAVTAAVVSAALGAALLVLFNIRHPGIAFEMDRDLPRYVTGFYDLERLGDETWAWTSGRATLRLAGLDRSVNWTCSVRFRGTRPPDLPQPEVDALVDGVLVQSVTATNEYADLSVPLLRRGGDGAVLALSVAPTFVPGGGDPRELGVQVDRLSCAPEGWRVSPPGSAIVVAAGSAALIGAAAVLAGLSIAAAWGGAFVVALAVALLLTSGGAAFGSYGDVVLTYAAWASVALVVIARGLALWLRRPLRAEAHGVILVSCGAALVQMLGLLHPAKPIVDALFQAHRLEWVLDGRYFFTQPMPSGVEFPYAIGLYVASAPFAGLTTDLVSLLRVVVVVVQALAGALLYPMAVRGWRSPRAGLWAVVLFQLVPLPYVVVGNGNLTNAFGQGVALVAMAAVALWPLSFRRPVPVVGIALLVALAFCSHVSTVTLLGVILVVTAGVYAMSRGRALRPAAIALLAATVAAGVFSVAVYYAHFGDVYARAYSRVFAQGGDASAAPATAEPQAAPSRVARAGVAIRETLNAVGWPVLLLGATGGWLVWRRSRSEETVGDAADDGREVVSSRLTGVVAAWILVWLLFAAASVVMRVEGPFERYAAEFLGRVNLATFPAWTLLGGRVLAAARRPSAGEPLAGVLLAIAVVGMAGAAWLGAGAWLRWFA